MHRSFVPLRRFQWTHFCVFVIILMIPLVSCSPYYYLKNVGIEEEKDLKKTGSSKRIKLALKSDDWRTRRAAAQVLIEAKKKARSLRSDVLAALSAESVDENRYVYFEALESMQAQEESLPILRSFTKRWHNVERTNFTIWACSRIQNPKTVEMLVFLLGKVRDDYNRYTIFDTLKAKRAEEDCLPVLKGFARDEYDDHERMVFTVWALGQIESPESANILVTMLRHEWLLYDTIRALGDIRQKEALPALNRLLSYSQQTDFLWEWLYAVQKVNYPNKDTVAHLAKLSRDHSDEDVRNYAKNLHGRLVLLTISGRPSSSQKKEKRNRKRSFGRLMKLKNVNPNKKLMIWRISAKSGVTDSVADSITGYLSMVVEKMTGATVVSESLIKTVLDGEELAQKCGDEENSCIADIGNALGIEEAFSGDLGKIGQTWMLNLRRIDNRKVEVIKRASYSMKGEIDTLIEALPSIIAELYDQDYEK